MFVCLKFAALRILTYLKAVSKASGEGHRISLMQSSQHSITFSLLKRGGYEFDCKVFGMGRKVGGFSDGEYIIIFWSM